MYKEKCVKIPNSSEIREILIKIHYFWKTNTHTDTHTHVVICFHFSIFVVIKYFPFEYQQIE